MKILLASAGVPGHLNPLLAAGTILAGHHDVVVQTSDELRPVVDATGLRFLPELPGSKTFGGTFIAQNPWFLTLPPGLEKVARAVAGFFAGNIAVHWRNLQRALRQFPADLVLADSFYFGTLPMLLGPRSTRPAIAHMGISVLNAHSGKGVPPRPGSSAAERTQQHQELQSLLLQPIQMAFDRALVALGYGPLPYPAMEILSVLSDLYLHPSIASFEYPEASTAAVHFIGRLPLPAGQTPLPPWWESLDPSKRLVVVTQGTIANYDFSELVGPTLTGLAGESDLTVLITTGNRPIESIPVPIPANARVATFLPLEDILPHVDLLITNGGYGTVNMALAHGVPIVAAGLTEDKEEVCAHVQWAGVGIDLHTQRPEPEALRRAAREVLDQPHYRARAAVMAEKFAAHRSSEELLELIERAAARAGSKPR